MADTHYHFIPILRKGLVTKLNSTPTGLRWKFPVSITVATSLPDYEPQQVSQWFELFGPGDIVGYNKTVHQRHYPTTHNNEAEINYFPYIEFNQPDFLWTHSAKQASPEDDANRVPPWLTLIVLKAKDGNEAGEYNPDDLVQNQQNKTGIVTIENGTLPHLEEAWRWAHIQTIGPEEFDWDKINELSDSEKKNIKARLMCPRKLEPKKKYGAFLVPTFMAGAITGGGDPPDRPENIADINALTLSWKKDSSEGININLPFYFHWEFRTGKRGDFESLVRRLKPREFTGLGKQLMDVRQPGYSGLNGKLNNPLLLTDQEGNSIESSDFIHREGVFISLHEESGSTFDNWGRDKARFLNEFQTLLRSLLNKGEQGDELRLVPHVYGKWHARKTELSNDNSNWLEHLNFDPRHRFAANLGAQYVKDNQEKLMLQAYRQLGEVDDINRAIQLYAYGAKTINSGLRRMEIMSPGQKLAFVSVLGNRLLTKNVNDGSKLTIRSRFHKSDIPNGFYNSSSSKFYNKDRFYVKTEGQNPINTWLFKAQNPGNNFKFLPLGLGVQSFADFQVSVQDIWKQVDSNDDIEVGLWGEVLNRNDVTLNPNIPPKSSPWYRSHISTISGKGPQIEQRPNIEIITRDDYSMIVTRVENIKRENGQNFFLKVADTKNINPIRKIKFGGKEISIDPNKHYSDISTTPIPSLSYGNDGIPINFDPKKNQSVYIEIDPNPPGTVKASLIESTSGEYLVSGSVRVLGNKRSEQIENEEFSITLPEGYYQLEVTDDKAPNKKGYTEIYVESGEILIMDLAYVKPDKSEERWIDFEDLKLTEEEEDSTPFRAIDYMTMDQLEILDSHVQFQLSPRQTIGIQSFSKALAILKQMHPDEESQQEASEDIRILWHPSFNNIPLVEELRKMSESYILPGIEKIPNNTITLLATNRRFIESFLIGANHEMASELLWREFPTDQQGSYFQQFWDPSNYIPTSQDINKAREHFENSTKSDSIWESLSIAEQQREVIKYMISNEYYRDISPLHNWELNSELGQHQPLDKTNLKNQEQTVLLIKGDLLSRFPNALIFLIEGVATNEDYTECIPRFEEYLQQEKGNEFLPVEPSNPIFPSFSGSLPPDITYLKFDISPEKIKTNKEQGQAGFFLVFEERVSSARFGLDEDIIINPESDKDEDHDYWNDLSWKHFSGPNTEIKEGMYLNDLVPNGDFQAMVQGKGDYVWDKSSARIAQATLQKHVRVSVHVDQMIPNKHS